ncbi:carboxylate--amine ligase [Bifidobacterium subtile]|uniref:Carboxylate--amine ligase n=1 Tax=Bifidobacterium subtile TaxID=77635 RepID=A0A087E0H2_9BIFI|nr:carboxylate--amine ligase [Bifidobacterium subtile]KFJ01273.1 carboxylate--amine ligase [Bifidobacterium subtile]QOL37060.1 carboxylate--amine ligase [Bifidobacterium subtile]
MKQFQPILLGSDINAYGMARAFHEEYGLVSTAFAHFQLSPTKFSHILDMHIVPGFGEPETFRATLLDYGRRMKEQRPDTTLLVIPCGDLYANLLSQCGSELHEYFVFNTLDQALNRRLSLKSSFYETCEQYELPHPATKVVSAEGMSRGDYRELPFDYPVAMKPADSALWLDIDFPGRKKAFVINDPDELDTLIRRSYEAGYTGDMIIQDFIPGDDSRMRVLNAYVDQHHRVRMMFLGHPLLEDPTPEAVGNYAAIIPDYNEPIMLLIKDFLEDIGYQGVANFDMKYDERDGEYKLFEINLRQGRSSYFVTLNGCNLARYFVEDLVEDTAFDAQPLLAHGSKLWMEIPRSIFRDYVRDSEDKRRGLVMIKRGDWGTTLEYRKDMNPTRWLMIRHMFSIYKKRYAQYFSHKEDLA